eukprot:scaffold100396_cov33-Tisochrysis_lutea.AAC.1
MYLRRTRRSSRRRARLAASAGMRTPTAIPASTSSGSRSASSHTRDTVWPDRKGPQSISC